MSDENLKEVEKLQSRPFTKFCMSIGAVPSSYLSGLSIEEQLLWLCSYLEKEVIPAVNNNAESVEELQGLYEELHDYVEHYFDNLDVQEEINNKLDEMAATGTLSEIIGQYINPLIESQNNRITSFENDINDQITNQNNTINEIDNKVDSVANGSPLVANSIDDMIDTTRTYVLTSDGKWYYYNGSTWVAGGTYQTTGIGNENVTYSNLFEDLQNSFDYNYDETTSYSDGFVDGSYIDPSGTIHTSANNSCYIEIDVNPKETYRFSTYYNTNVMGLTNGTYVIKDNSNNVIDSDLINSTTNTSIEKIISIPNTGNKLFINSARYNNSTVMAHHGINVEKIKSYIQKDPITYDQLDTNLKNIFVEEYTNIQQSDLTTVASPGRLNPGFLVNIGSGYTLYSYNVNPGEKFKLNIYSFYGQPSLFLGSKDAIYDIPTTTSSDITYHLHGQIERYIGETENAYNDFEFTIPAGCDIIYMNNDNTKTITLKKVTRYKINAEDVALDTGSVETNPLYNKTILFNGDSITHSNSTSDPDQTPVGPNDNRAWVSRIKTNNENLTVYGYGVSGTTIAKRSGQNDSILERTTTMFSDHPSADYIILQGGINDMFTNVPLGEITSGYNDTYDEYTFCGALESLFRYVTLNFAGKKCGFINMFKVPSCSNQPTYNDKIITICKKWQIPVLNLYEESDLNYYLDTIKANYSQTTEQAPSGDGLHPNYRGYNLLQNKIESWIKSL